jgi:hypothetical protein
VETKVGHAELQSEITQISLKVDDVHKELMKKSSTFATNKELQNLTQLVDQKANVNDVNEALATKASKDSVINALHRKANKAETDSMIKAKVDIEDFQAILNSLNNKVDINEFEKLHSICENKAERSDIISLSNTLNNKAELKDFEFVNVCYQELKRDNTKRLDDFDQDIDRLIENIKKEFQNLNIVINNLDVKKADFKEFEKMNTLMSKKSDSESLASSLSQLKTDIYDSFAHFKNDLHQNKKIFEEGLNEKISIIEKNLEKSTEDNHRTKEKINEVFERKKSDQEDTLKQSKHLVSNFAKEVAAENNLLRSELQKLNSEFDDILNKKMDKKEFEMVRNKLFSEIEQKAEIMDLENIFKNIQKEISDKSEDNRININQTLKSFESDIQRALEKKANMYEVTTLLNSKADAASTNLTVQNKVGVSEFENLKLNFDKINREMMNKLDYNKFEAYMSDSRGLIEELQKDLMMKSNIKEILSLLKNKADIDDVNKALTQIHEELDTKCNIEGFNSAMDNQAIINDALCAENCVARWTWKSGQVKNGYAVPWEVQTVNTAPDNYLWEKEKTSVMVVAAGLYEITMGFYADKKPTVQILINGEPVMSAVNSASYVIHHSSGKLKNVGKHSNGNITGLTMVDFICLPERSRISISYSGEEGGEGFLGLRKI